MNAKTQTLSRLARSLALGAALVATPTLAQFNTATLTGTVTETQTRQPLDNVAVTLTSPSLQGEWHVKTDKTGYYRAPQLPPGKYAVRFSKDGFWTVKYTDVTLTATSTGRINTDLPLGEAEAPAP